MDTNTLLQQIKNLEQMLLQQQAAQENNRSNNNIPMMSTDNSDPDVSPEVMEQKLPREHARELKARLWRSKNLEYRRQYDSLRYARHMLEKKMRDLRKQYGITERASPVRSKKR